VRKKSPLSDAQSLRYSAHAHVSAHIHRTGLATKYKYNYRTISRSYQPPRPDHPRDRSPHRHALSRSTPNLTRLFIFLLIFRLVPPQTHTSRRLSRAVYNTERGGLVSPARAGERADSTADTRCGRGYRGGALDALGSGEEGSGTEQTAFTVHTGRALSYELDAGLTAAAPAGAMQVVPLENHATAAFLGKVVIILN
jgi:hypothetical protein